MNLSKFILPLFLVAVFLSSCSSVYMPNVPVAPMFSKKGELQAGGHVSFKGNLNANLALAVSDHVAVIANGSVMDNAAKRKDFSQSLWEVGVGYFSTFGEENKRVFEVYGGYGKGNTDRAYKDVTYDGPVLKELQQISFDKYFLQLNYSSKKNKSIKLFGERYPLSYGTVLRVSHVSMTDFTSNYVSQRLEDNVFIEPIFFTRMALSNNFQLQYSNGTNIGLIKRSHLKAGNTVFTFGIVYNLF